MIPVGILASANRHAEGPPPDPGSDPHWSSVVSLLHFDGEDGPTAFPDEAGRTWTSSGAVQIDTEDPKFGEGSALFSGGRLHSVSPTYAIGTADFTLEFWLKSNQFGASGPTLVDNRNSAGPTLVIYQPSVTDQLNVYLGGEDRITASGLPNNQWLHLALCRVSGVSRFFVNGVSAGSYNDTHSYGDGATTSFRLGQNHLNGAALSGRIDEYRFTNGVGRYSSNFDPPTSPFPNRGP